jgi:rubrerythrin
MKDATSISLRNRTGMQMSPADSQDLLEAGGGQFAESLPPDPLRGGLAETRAEYIAEAEALGTVPAPVTPVGVAKSAAKLVKGERLQVFMDKLSERAAYERGGTRLYDALLTKYRAEFGNQKSSRTKRDQTPVTEATLTTFRNQEADHFRLVCAAIQQLGGDPTAQTPSADAVGVMSTGLIQTVTDPRTSIAQCVAAVLTAELTDVASWDLLAQLADALNQKEMARDFRDALAHEEQHLQVIRHWHTALVLGQSGATRGVEH